MNWQKSLKGKVRLQEPLKDKTTFKIGGRAEVFVEPKNKDQLKADVILASSNKVPVFILGAGSNILVDDLGVKGIVIRLRSKEFKNISFSGNKVRVGAGVALIQLIRESAKHSLSGLEFLAGIPGSVGGALMMNAGSWGSCIGDLVEEVMVMGYNGKIKIIGCKSIKFAYRNSGLDRYIILSATFKLSKKDKSVINKSIKNLLAKKTLNQDNSSPNAGCVFKNTSGESAGKLIDLCGLKGRRVGGAAVSEKHANFFLNKNNASAKDVLELMEIAKLQVKKQFDINLKPEIKIWR